MLLVTPAVLHKMLELPIMTLPNNPLQVTAHVGLRALLPFGHVGSWDLHFLYAVTTKKVTKSPSDMEKQQSRNT